MSNPFWRQLRRDPHAVNEPPHGAAPERVDAVQTEAVIAELYEVKHLIGYGGMGQVWLVHHRRWNCDLVMKELQPDSRGDRSARRAFKAEAENWVNLPMHPNVVTAYYVREIDGVLRIFAEYIDGESLDKKLERGSLPLYEALDLAIQCCAGLAHAHDAGLIHRDVKPNNVLLANNGTAKLMDFGLSKSITSLEEAPVLTAGRMTRSTFTARGGTPTYMSPEQSRREKDKAVEVGPATDIWSFGIMFYEMLTGRRPEDGTKARQFVLAHREKDFTFPPEILALIDRCLEPDPTERWMDFKRLGDQLRMCYRHYRREEYPRPLWPPIMPGADELNNRALSLLDLGKPQAARRCWKDALTRDPFHPQSTYNLLMLAWRNGEITDLPVIQQLDALVEASHPADWTSPYFLALAQWERGDEEAATSALQKALVCAPAEPLVRIALDQIAGEAHERHCLYSVPAHQGRVIAVAMSADGAWALSCGEEHGIRLWNERGECVRTFSGHAQTTLAVALSADGAWALSAGMDATLRAWRVETGEGIWRKDGLTDGITAVCLSADGHTAATGGRDHRVNLWDMGNGERLRALVGHTGAINAVAMSRDGEWVAAGSDDLTLRVWKAGSGRCRLTFKGHTRAISSVAISDDGHWAVSGSWDNTVRCWDIQSGRCVRVFTGHTAPVLAVAMSADGRWIASGSEDRTVRLWHAETGQCVRTYTGHALAVNAVAMSADGHDLISGGEDATLRGWTTALRRAKTALSLAICRIQPAEERAMAQMKLQRLLACAEALLAEERLPEAHAYLQQARAIPGYTRVPEVLARWARLTQRARRIGVRGIYRRHTFAGHTDAVMTIAMSTDARSVLTGSRDGTLRLWETISGRCWDSINVPSRQITAGYLGQDLRWALAGGVDGTLWRWEIITDHLARYFRDDTHNLSAFAMSADEGDLLFPGAKDTLEIWDFAGGTCIRQFGGDGGNITAFGLSLSGALVFAASQDLHVRLYEASSGECRQIFTGHQRRIIAVALSADERRMVSADDRQLRCWEVATGNCARVLPVSTGSITALCMSPDARWILTGGSDGTVRLWDAESGECLQTLEGHSTGITALSWSQDLRWILSARQDASVQLWEVDWALETCEVADWDDGATPYLQAFLRRGRSRGEQEIRRFLALLGSAGFGWLHRESVRRKVAALATDGCACSEEVVQGGTQ